LRVHATPTNLRQHILPGYVCRVTVTVLFSRWVGTDWTNDSDPASTAAVSGATRWMSTASSTALQKPSERSARPAVVAQSPRTKSSAAFVSSHRSARAQTPGCDHVTGQDTISTSINGETSDLGRDVLSESRLCVYPVSFPVST